MTMRGIVLQDELGGDVGFVRLSNYSGWLWACSLCPAANAPGANIRNPVDAVAILVEHAGRLHPGPAERRPAVLGLCPYGCGAPAPGPGQLHMCPDFKRGPAA